MKEAKQLYQHEKCVDKGKFWFDCYYHLTFQYCFGLILPYNTYTLTLKKKRQKTNTTRKKGCQMEIHKMKSITAGGLLGWAATQNLSNAVFKKLHLFFCRSAVSGSLSWICLLKAVRTEQGVGTFSVSHREFTSSRHPQAMGLHSLTPAPLGQNPRLWVPRRCAYGLTAPLLLVGPPNLHFSGSLLGVKKTGRKQILRKWISQ